MRRRCTMSCALVTALLAVMAGSASAAGLGPTTRVTVTPRTGTARTHFAFRFRVPVATGRFGTMRRTDTLSVTGPPGARCESRAVRALKAARKGKRVKVTMRPAKGGWCAGQWHGTVVQSETPRCNPTPGRVCPDLVIAPRVIASFRFKVKRGATNRPPTQPSGDVPTFKGLVSAITCPSGGPQPGTDVPDPVIGPEEASYMLSWNAASDPVTPSSEIVYDIFIAMSPGAEDYAHPSFTTAPGATTFTTPPQLSRGTLYFVVRARNKAGHEDTNKVERAGMVSCPPLPALPRP